MVSSWHLCKQHYRTKRPVCCSKNVSRRLDLLLGRDSDFWLAESWLSRLPFVPVISLQTLGLGLLTEFWQVDLKVSGGLALLFRSVIGVMFCWVRPACPTFIRGRVQPVVGRSAF